jgi:hypothetical protein
MTVTPTDLRLRPLRDAAWIAAATALVVCLPFASGPAALAGLLLAGVAALGAALAVWTAAPAVLVTLVPALLPSPMIALTFGWEIALVLLACVVALHGLRIRAAWLTELDPLEVSLLLFTAYGLFTGFWSPDQRFYVLGARRLLLGCVTLWVASRLPHIAPRPWFDWGVIAAASALAITALLHNASTGFSPMQALIHRTETTNLGWGTANYVATLLLLCAPTMLRLVVSTRGPGQVATLAAWILTAQVQLIVASRAATVLFLGGTITQLLRAARRFRAWVLAGSAVILAATLLSPLGAMLLTRLVSLRELGSMTIRIWYFREGGRRLVENLPWGMGLSQGYAHGDKLQGIDPHNYWLLLGGDLGIPGVLLWAAVLVVLVRRCLALRRPPDPRPGDADVLLLTIVLANLHTLVEPTYQGTQYTFLFFWIVGGTLAYARAARPAPSPSGV